MISPVLAQVYRVARVRGIRGHRHHRVRSVLMRILMRKFFDSGLTGDLVLRFLSGDPQHLFRLGAEALELRVVGCR